MFSKDEKKLIGEKLKGYPKKEVFDLINNGGTREEVMALVDEIILNNTSTLPEVIELEETGKPYSIFGKQIITQNAIDDFETIMRLPFVIGGALMPDAHRTAENSVPVGGVVLSEDVVPDIVSNDIACSVYLTEYNILVDDYFFLTNKTRLVDNVRRNTFFGNSINPLEDGLKEDFYIYRPTESDMLTIVGKEALRSCEKRVRTNFGTSGDGNHFFNVGVTDKGRLAFMSHFGSRSIGATIAKLFSDEAKKLYKMPKGMGDAPLRWNSPLAKDYFLLMNWAGDFAEAGHKWLHNYMRENLVKSGVISEYIKPLTKIYTKHNFAWETSEGILHRKGSTPADYGQMGVIPATMGHPAKIIVGLGNPTSFNSTSHGAGRTHSRGQAFLEFKNQTQEYIENEFGIIRIGADVDESPDAYKDINKVMFYQQTCADVIGEFFPKIVRMAEPRIRRNR
jgi:tRNA-splicing ligase RtcB